MFGTKDTLGTQIQRIKPAANEQIGVIQDAVMNKFSPSNLNQDESPSLDEEDVPGSIDDDADYGEAKQEDEKKKVVGDEDDERVVKPKKYGTTNSDGGKSIKADLSNSVKAGEKALPKQPVATAGAAAAGAAGAAGAATTPKSDCNDIEYVVMIDAGSTGSRVHVYEFDTCVQPPQLISELFEAIKPGLSSFDTDTVGAAKSLDPLLKKAMAKVPTAKQKCTPVAVKATAGLRLLGDEKSGAILEEVRRHLSDDYPFAVVPEDGISIMDGRDEGVYAWITANYLLGNIGGGSSKLPTAAVFDLGGGSTQIVFEPDSNTIIPEGEQKYKFTFGQHDFTLYQYSHLGYGLMQGRNKINQAILTQQTKGLELTKYTKQQLKSLESTPQATIDIINPCVPPGSTIKNVQIEVSSSEIYIVNMKALLEPSGTQCRAIAEQVLNKQLECKVKPCSFNGIHQPSLTKTFPIESDMYIFSYFYDRTFPIGMPTSFTVEELKDMTQKVCKGTTSWDGSFFGSQVDELKEEPYWCSDLSFITAMLHTGYDIPLKRELKTARTIEGNELGWCLGASLPLLDKTNKKWKCRIEKIDS
ncbi:GDA1 [[Candida] subhashii]|uniref:guanosine-diphosphatase n=1 Tax=[Candida] subhashii TaxID=561895 RepID=A0A8J5QF75_9ASCO|nr:GDA1 [[Candida] subhashii]KAG7661827.1 GDA1 [[Candida] subhashii]